MTLEEAVDGLRAGRELSIGPTRDDANRLMVQDLIAHFEFNEPELQLVSRHESRDYFIVGVGTQTDAWVIFRATPMIKQ